MVQRNGTWGYWKPAVVGEPATPDEGPDWDCNTEEGRGHLERDRVTISQGLKRGGLKSYEYHKTLRSDSKGKRITLLSSEKDRARPIDFIRQ